MVQRSRDWLRESQAELAAAEHLLAAGDWSWCCFTAQQAAEKAVKALCEEFRVSHLGHNLNELLGALRAHILAPESVRMACARLNRYYIPARYPDSFDNGAPVEQFFEPDARQACQDAADVYRFAEGAVGPP